MKQECPTYLKTIGKSKALAAALSDTKPKDDSDNEDDEILYHQAIQEVHEECQWERLRQEP